MYTPTTNSDFDAIRIRLASPEQIRSWSHGEVTKPETINYRTQKPEKDGLFCEKIFGPCKDWECYCGKYKKIRYKGVICDKCGVEVTRAIVRRERMAHIDLAVPVTHIWFFRGVPSQIGLILNLSIQSLERVVYFANFIITEVDEKLKRETTQRLKEEYKQRLKDIENTFSQKVHRMKSVVKDIQELDSQLIQANQERETTLAEMEEQYEVAEKELKELKPFEIISEYTFHALSLKYGYLFEAEIGAEAIFNLLKKIDLEKTIQMIEYELPGMSGAKYDKLMKRVKLLKSLKMNRLRPEWMILTTLPVIPPELRPMVPLDGGRFATSDLNDLYRRVINRNNRLKRLMELNAPEVIVRNEKRMLQEAVDALIDNSARHSKTVVASTGQKRQLKSLADILKGKEGRFRKNLLGKRTDYSARSVIVVGPKLKLDQCGIPKKMALELFKPFVISKLIQGDLVHNIRSANRFIESDRPEVWDILEKLTEDAFVFLNRAPTLHRLGIQAFRPLLIEGKAIQVHPLVCKAFNADFDGDQMAVHLPLTEQAKREARDIMLSTHNTLKPANGIPVNSPDQDIILGCYYLTSLNDETRKKPFTCPEEAILAYQEGVISLQTHIWVRMQTGDNGTLNLAETSAGRLLFMSILPKGVEYPHRVMDAKALNQLVRVSLEYAGRERTVKFLDEVKELGYRYATKSGFSFGMTDLPFIHQKADLIASGERQAEEAHEQYEQGLLTDSERHSQIIEIWTGVKNQIANFCKDALDKTGSIAAMIHSGARGSLVQLTQMMGMRGWMMNPSGDIIELPVKGNFKEGLDVLEYFISTHGARKGLADTALRTANAGYLTRRLVDVVQDVVIWIEDCGDDVGIRLTEEESETMQSSLVDRIVGRYLTRSLRDENTKKVVVRKGTLVTDAMGRELRENAVLKESFVRSPLSCRLKKGLCQKCYGYDLAYNELVKIGTAVGIIAAQSIGEPGTQLTMKTFHTGGVAGADITQGLPRIEELFELRPPKRKAIVSEHAGKIKVETVERQVQNEEGVVIHIAQGEKTVKVFYTGLEEDVYILTDREGKVVRGTVKVKEGKQVNVGDILFVDEEKKKMQVKRGGIVKVAKNKIIVVVEMEKVAEYIIPPGYHLLVRDDDLVTAGDSFTDGSMDLQQLYRLKGKEAVQQYILYEVQHIYTTQAGTKLNDRHIEIIMRQMFSRVMVHDAGDTDLLPGERIELAEVFRANDQARAHGKKEADFEVLFLGISKVSLTNNSFLSAASFQETQRVLIHAALTGKVDPLEGLKENVIIGRIIPAGSGFWRHKNMGKTEPRHEAIEETEPEKVNV